jgi:hypothetical protein
VYRGFWWGNLKGGGQLENLGVDGFIQLKLLLNGLGVPGLVYSGSVLFQRGFCRGFAFFGGGGGVTCVVALLVPRCFEGTHCSL